MSNIQYWEIQELALFAMGKTEDQVTEIIDNDGEGEKDIDTLIYEKFDVDFDQFAKIAEALLKLTPCVESPLSGRVSHAFVRNVTGGMVAIVSQEAK